MAFIKQEKNGDWNWYYVNPTTGKRTKKKILRADKTAPRDRREAERLIAPFRKGIEELDSIRTRERAVVEISQARQLIASRTHRLNDLASMYLDTPSAPKSPARRKYASLVASRFAEWCRSEGVEGISDVDAALARRYMESGLPGYSKKSRNDQYFVLKAMFKAVGRLIGLGANPWDDVKPEKTVVVSRKDFTAEQVAAIYGAFKSWFGDGSWTPPHNDQLMTGFVLGVYAGCRLKDACLMQWSAIDWDKNTITYTPCKTRGSTGVEVVLPILDGPERECLELAKTWADPTGYVAPAIADMYKNHRNALSRHYIRCFALATGVQNRVETDDGKARSVYGFHSLRHTTASILVNAGVSLEVIAALVGHSSTEMTRIYAHVSSLKAADEMRRAFSPGAKIRQQLNAMLDGLDEKRLGRVLEYVKNIK